MHVLFALVTFIPKPGKISYEITAISLKYRFNTANVTANAGEITKLFRIIVATKIIYYMLQPILFSEYFLAIYLSRAQVGYAARSNLFR